MKKVSTWRPAIEIKQTEKNYRVKVQLPGVKKDDINIELDNDFMTITAEIEELEKQGLTFISAEVDKIPQNTVSVTDPDAVENLRKMLDLLEESDDVQNVYHNADLPEEEDDED